MYNLFEEFYLGRLSVSYDCCENRPKSLIILKNIDTVPNIIEDRHVVYCEIDLRKTAIHSILHEYSTVKKICARWIPHNLTKEKKTRFS